VSARAAVERIRQEVDTLGSARIGGRRHAAGRTGRRARASGTQRRRRRADLATLTAAFRACHVCLATVVGTRRAMAKSRGARRGRHGANPRLAGDACRTGEHVGKAGTVVTARSAVLRVGLQVQALAAADIGVGPRAIRTTLWRTGCRRAQRCRVSARGPAGSAVGRIRQVRLAAFVWTRRTMRESHCTRGRRHDANPSLAGDARCTRHDVWQCATVVTAGSAIPGIGLQIHAARGTNIGVRRRAGGAAGRAFRPHRAQRR
jgi:hypothetical protein